MWSPTSTEVIVKNNLGDIILYDVKNGKKLKKYSTTGPIEINLTPDGKYLGILQGNQNGMLEVLNAKTFEKVVTKNDMIWPHAISSSFDGKYFVCSDDNGELYVYNTTTWDYQKIKVTNWALQIASHPSKNIFALNDGTGSNVMYVELVDIDKMSSIARGPISAYQDYWQFNVDGTKLMGSTNGNNIVTIDATTLKYIESITGASAEVVTSFKDEENGQLITADDNGINVWNITTGAKEHFWVDKPYSLHQTTANEFIASDWLNNFSIYNTSNFTKRELFRRRGVKVDKWVLKGDKLLILERNEGGKDPYGHIIVYNFTSNKVLDSFSVYLICDQLKYKLQASRFKAADISPDGSKVAFSTFWQDGFGREWQYSRIVKIFDLHSGKVIKEIFVNSDIKKIVYQTETKILINDFAYDMSTNKDVETNQSDKNLYSSMDLFRPVETKFDFSKLNLHIEVSTANELTFFNKKTNEQVLTIAAKKNNEWIAYAPSGEFTSSLNGTKRVNWILGNKILPFDALKEKFENPSLIKSKLSSVVNNVTPVIVPKVVTKVDPDLFVTPYKLELISAQNINTKESEFEIQLKVIKENSSIPDAVVIFEINGRKDRGFGVGTVKKSPAETIVTRKLQLQDGINNIKVYIDYKQAQVEIKNITITKEAVKNINSLNAQLWFFGVGVSKYENPSQNLEFANKDIVDVAKLLKKQEGVLYQKVNTKVLTDENATEKNVRIDLNEFLKMATSEDIIIIFLAGHGSGDQGNLFEHDAIPYTGMDISKIKNFLANRPINQKALLLLDVCHAGTVKSSMTARGNIISSDEAIKELVEGTGSVVLASSTGKESSYESVEFGGGHGAFSYAILRGITRGEADKAGDKNGYVSLLEMQGYVSRKVVEITKGGQHPTTPQSQNLRDFPLFKN